MGQLKPNQVLNKAYRQVAIKKQKTLIILKMFFGHYCLL